VSDCDVVADYERRTRVFGVFAVGDVEHGEILDVGPAPYADEIHVATRHHVVPDAALGADLHVADNYCRFSYENGGIDLRLYPLE
jgi:thioredoxin reductase